MSFNVQSKDPSKHQNKLPSLSISVVVPVFNEAENIEILFNEIKSVCTQNNYEYEIIFVDDGSTDATSQIVRGLKPLKYIRLRRNFGQTAALDAGIKAAKYPLIVTMDGDGQNDPADIPILVHELYSKDCDVVSGWRKKRKDPLLKHFVSRVAYLLRQLLLHDEIHDSGCTLKIYKKECFDSVNLYGEGHRFIPALLKIKGFNIGEVVVSHRPRLLGVTKYNWKRTIKGFIDMFSIWFWHRYAVRPMHLLGVLGLFCLLSGSIVSVVGIAFYICDILLFSKILPIVAVFLFISGINFFIFGLIADMLSRNYFGTTKDITYSVKEILENYG